MSYEIVKAAASNIQKYVSRSSKEVISKGGTFEHMRSTTMRKVCTKYPGVDATLVLGGFDHEYAQHLMKI